MGPPISGKHPYDVFLDEFDKQQQAQRVRDLERLQAQTIREAERLGQIRGREQVVDSRVHADGRLRGQSIESAINETMRAFNKELRRRNSLPAHDPQANYLDMIRQPAPAATPATPTKAEPKLKRKLLLL